MFMKCMNKTTTILTNYFLLSSAVQNERDRIIRRPSEDTSGNGITANMLLQAELLSRPPQSNAGSVGNKML